MAAGFQKVRVDAAHGLFLFDQAVEVRAGVGREIGRDDPVTAEDPLGVFDHRFRSPVDIGCETEDRLPCQKPVNVAHKDFPPISLPG